MTDLPDAADRAHNAVVKLDGVGRAENERLRSGEDFWRWFWAKTQTELAETQDKLDAAHDEIRRLHAAGMDASGDAVFAERERVYWKDVAARAIKARDDYRQRAVEQEREAARLRAERDDLRAQLDAGLDDCLEMHAAFVAVKRERDEWKRLAGDRQERVDAAWDIINTLHKMVSKELYELRPDWAHVNVIGDTMNVIDVLKEERDKWHAAAVQGYRLMRRLRRAADISDRTIGVVGADYLRDLVRRYREGAL